MPTSSTSRFSLNKTSRGYTLIELLVSLAIIGVIASIVITNQSTYNDSIVLNTTVTNASLAVRQAQVSGVSVREFQAGSGNFTAAYGTMFQRNMGYYYFADLQPRDGYYDGPSSCPTGSNQECISVTNFQPGVSVDSICSIDLSDNETCNVGRVDITFVRPDADAHFFFWDTSISPMIVSNVKGVRIEFTNASGTKRSVVVYTTGQISVR